MIETTLNREAAEKLLEDNSILFRGQDYVPDYRVYELFGKRAASYFSKRGENNAFKGGRDWIYIKDISGNKFYLFTRTGFYEFVAFNNYAVMTKERSNSQEAAAADQMEADNLAEIERQDAEALAEAEALAGETGGEGET